MSQPPSGHMMGFGGKNWQAHSDTQIELHHGINVFTGISNNGKSTLLRILYWLLFNEYRGDWYRSWWGGDTEAYALFEGRTRISRVKTNSDDVYRIQTLAGINEFRAFSRSVPTEIESFINMSECNIQKQLGKHFMLADRPVDVAKYLNRLVKLDDMELALHNISKMLTREKSSRSHEKENLKRLEAGFAEFLGLDVVEAAVAKLENMDKMRVQMINERTQIEGLVSQAESVQKSIDKNQHLLTVEKELQGVLELVRQHKECQQEILTLKNVSTDITTREKLVSEQIDRNNVLAQILKDLESLLAQTKQLDKVRAERSELILMVSDVEAKRTLLETNVHMQSFWTERAEALLGLQKLTVELEAVQTEHAALTVAVNNCTKTQANITETQTRLSSLEKHRDEIFPDICPLCNQVVHKESAACQ